MALLLRPLYLFVCLLVLTGCAITTDRDVLIKKGEEQWLFY